jgi:hypothetical protein
MMPQKIIVDARLVDEDGLTMGSSRYLLDKPVTSQEIMALQSWCAEQAVLLVIPSQFLNKE